ncbi:hypothetical protein D3C71_2064320 [compost metagenome]
MFIHCIVVIHVELHHRDDFAKIRDELTQYARFIHAAQDQFRIARRGQHFQKQAIGFCVLAQFSVDEL